MPRSIGLHQSFVRCYRAGNNIAENLAMHRKATATVSLQRIKEVFAQTTDSIPTVMFVRKNHLPPELLAQLEEADDFQRFCEVVAFSSGLMTYVKSAGIDLPESASEHSACSARECDGFAVTVPVQDVDMQKANSFNPLELIYFLGSDHVEFAGRMVFVSLAGDPSIETIAEVIARHSQELNPQSREATPSALHPLAPQNIDEA
ncbi:MAG: hypothetical protein HQ596_01435 [Candidatus Saganbacteria bacterium]|nr:hypothetical protein [Candidatus Saganbacteria bacterium]